MSAKCRNSSSAFTGNHVVTDKPKQSKQNILIFNRVVVGNKQKCLECGGVPALKNGKISSLFPRNLPYPHKTNCSQEGRF